MTPFRSRTGRARLRPSRKGDCYDNAVVESFFAGLNTECVHLHDYATRGQAKQSLFEYIEGFHNRQRLHSSWATAAPSSSRRS